MQFPRHKSVLKVFEKETGTAGQDEDQGRCRASSSDAGAEFRQPKTLSPIKLQHLFLVQLATLAQAFRVVLPKISHGLPPEEALPSPIAMHFTAHHSSLFWDVETPS